MKLIRIGKAGQEKPGIVVDENTSIDVSAFGEDYDETFFGTDGITRLKNWLEENQSACPKFDKSIRVGPVIKKPSKIICVGLNYRKHAEETGAQLPKEPVLFFKATTALVGPNDDVVIPKGSKKTDWEVELAIVIGKTARYVEEADAMDHIAGYVLHNDYSEREHQLERSGQWVKGKSADTFAPLGPFIATKDEIPDPHNLNLWLKVNGKMMQNENTNDLVFKVPQLVSYISQFMTLLPGDVISSGTPAGVGLGMNPPLYLKDGDVVELGIQGLGTSSQKARAYEKTLSNAH
jgi:2-keto-4-pentenoate hydratase/2-oxohepta-3-ene-1,7-dioic acid hydratase in catechol pathway